MRSRLANVEKLVEEMTEERMSMEAGSTKAEVYDDIIARLNKALGEDE